MRADACPFMRARLRLRARARFCVACLVVACARVCVDMSTELSAPSGKPTARAARYAVAPPKAVVA